MYDAHVDALARSLITARSRRGTLLALLSAAMGLLTVTESEAKKHKKHKHGRSAPPSAPPSPPPPTGLSCGETQRLCNGACISVAQCCSHTDCAAAYACQNGSCTCASDRQCPPRTWCDPTTRLCVPCRPGGTLLGPGEDTRVCCGDRTINFICRDACPRGHADCPSGNCCFDIDGPAQNYCALTPDEPC